MNYSTLILNRLLDIKTGKEYVVVVRKARQKTLLKHPDAPGPFVSLKDCFRHEDGPVDVEKPLEGVVVYARMMNGKKHNPGVRIMTSRTVGAPMDVRACCIVFHSTGCYVDMTKSKYSTEDWVPDVWVDGHPAVLGEMNHAMAGSIISPEGKIGRAFQVVLIHMKKEIRETRHATCLAFDNETKCPVCMEVIVKSVSSDVCNHKFCDGCIKEIKKNTNKQHIECPCCRGNATKWFNDPIMDEMIWLGALDGKLGAVEAKTFLRRREDHGMGGVTKKQRASIFLG